MHVLYIKYTETHKSARKSAVYVYIFIGSKLLSDLVVNSCSINFL